MNTRSRSKFSAVNAETTFAASSLTPALPQPANQTSGSGLGVWLCALKTATFNEIWRPLGSNGFSAT